MQVLYLGRAPRTKETLPDFLKWRRVTRHPLVFRELTGSQRTPGFWGVTIKSFVQQSIDKYLEKRHNLCKEFTSSKIERIKNTIYKMIMEWLETSLPLSIKPDPEMYVELTNIIIPDIVSNYNEYL